MMTEVLQGMDQVGVELQEDLEAGLQAVQEVVHLPVLEAEHLRIGGDPETDIMVMLLRSMMSEYILLMSLLSLYFL